MQSDGMDTPEAAHEAFYRAFAEGNLDMMGEVWATAEDAICIHPGSHPIIGYRGIMNSWADIFAAGATARIEIVQVARFADPSLISFVVYERFVAPGGTGPAILATNVLRQDAGAWRMTLHHASPVARLLPGDQESATKIATRH